jgi:predicted MPP superfamily phosphohydrolase
LKTAKEEYSKFLEKQVLIIDITNWVDTTPTDITDRHVAQLEAEIDKLRNDLRIFKIMGAMHNQSDLSIRNDLRRFYSIVKKLHEQCEFIIIRDDVVVNHIKSLYDKCSEDAAFISLAEMSYADIKEIGETLKFKLEEISDIKSSHMVALNCSDGEVASELMETIINLRNDINNLSNKLTNLSEQCDESTDSNKVELIKSYTSLLK